MLPSIYMVVSGWDRPFEIGNRQAPDIAAMQDLPNSMIETGQPGIELPQPSGRFR